MFDPKSLLEMFAGEWAGDEEIAHSKWGAGGKAIASVSARLDFGGHVLVQDYSAQREGKPWFKAHAVIAFDESASAFKLYWFDSMGFISSEPEPGQWDGSALRFVRSSSRGQTRHTYLLTETGQYELVLESSFDGGGSWVPVMKGLYLRTSN